jgi:hypothetical protein
VGCAGLLINRESPTAPAGAAQKRLGARGARRAYALRSSHTNTRQHTGHRSSRWQQIMTRRQWLACRLSHTTRAAPAIRAPAPPAPRAENNTLHAALSTPAPPQTQNNDTTHRGRAREHGSRCQRKPQIPIVSKTRCRLFSPRDAWDGQDCPYHVVYPRVAWGGQVRLRCHVLGRRVNR